MLVVTGANGFIGSALVSALNQLGQNDLIVTDFVKLEERPSLLAGKNFSQFISPEALLVELANLKPTAVFHIGACSSTTEKDWDYLKNVNLEYPQKLFALCVRLRIPFYYASSAAVYGNGQEGFDDKLPTESFTPLNLYGKSKYLFDMWASAQNRTPPRWAGFRYFNVYGPNEYFKNEMASVAYKAFFQIKETGRLKLFRSGNPSFADGHQKRDFIYVKDITRWMIEVWQSRKFESGIYNMGSGKARTWLDLANAVFSAMNMPPEIEWIDMPESVANQYQYFTEAKMKRLFAQKISKPEWTLESGINDYVVNYLMRDQARY